MAGVRARGRRAPVPAATGLERGISNAAAACHNST